MNFEELYQRHAADVHRFALYLTGSTTEAEDITSETFVRAWAADASTRARTMQAYLFAIARNLHRKGHRRSQLHAAALSDVHSDQPNLEDEVAHRSELRAVLARLQGLSEISRAALLMHAFHGIPYAEIATALGITVASVKVKIHRARAYLLTQRS